MFSARSCISCMSCAIEMKLDLIWFDTVILWYGRISTPYAFVPDASVQGGLWFCTASHGIFHPSPAHARPYPAASLRGPLMRDVWPPLGGNPSQSLLMRGASTPSYLAPCTVCTIPPIWRPSCSGKYLYNFVDLWWSSAGSPGEHINTLLSHGTLEESI